MKSNQERKNHVRILIGLAMALGAALCALEYGKPIGKYVYKGISQDKDRWIEEDPVQVTMRLPEPPKQMPRPKSKVATASLLPSEIELVDNSDHRKELPVFEIDPDAVYVPIEYIDEPIIDPLDFADVMTEFPGGDEGLMKYLNDVLRYPSFAKTNHIQGSVYIQFVVDSKGEIDETSIKILGSTHAVLSEEAKKAILKMPQWKPGRQRLHNVAVNMKLPIKFKLN